MADDHSTGDPIPEVFDPDRIDARFVVAMSMARNDIEVALRDGIAAADDDRPDYGRRLDVTEPRGGCSRSSTARAPARASEAGQASDATASSPPGYSTPVPLSVPGAPA